MEFYKSSIITIGDELTSGFRLDTNSKWIASQLHSNKIDVNSIFTVGDNSADITKAIKSTINKDIKYLFITGGLGPTDDDKTLYSIKSLLKSQYFIDKEYYLFLKTKFKNIEYNNMIKNQSTKISRVNYLSNPKGSALPFYFKIKKTTIFVMPGVTSEMKDIFNNQIKKIIISDYKKRITSSLLTAGLGESLLSNKIQDIMDHYSEYIKFSFLPNYGGVVIRLESIDDNEELFFKVKEKIIRRLDKYYVTDEKISLTEFVLRKLKKNKLTISFAESCTGGLISKLITDYPGSSEVFKGSIVAYSNEVKKNILKIPPQTLLRYGAVSEEISKEMCQSAQNIFETDISVSTTGIAGPSGGTLDKPVGLVYISVFFGECILTKKFNFIKDRQINRKITLNAALNMVREIIDRKK